MRSWFRLWTEFIHDPKVQMMKEKHQRRLVMLFGIKAANEDQESFSDDEIRFIMRITPKAWAETKAIFIEKGFIDEDNNLLNWDKRQFVSDASASERVKNHREKKQSEPKKVKRFKSALSDDSCNNFETFPETDTDTEAETDIKENNIKEKKQQGDLSDFETFYNAYPRRVAKGQAERTWTKLKAEKTLPPLDVLLDAIQKQKRTIWANKAAEYIPHPSSWLNAKRWDDEVDTKKSSPDYFDYNDFDYSDYEGMEIINGPKREGDNV